MLLETLQDELKLFNETAKKQMEELQVRDRCHPESGLPFPTTVGGSVEDSFLFTYLFIFNKPLFNGNGFTEELQR